MGNYQVIRDFVQNFYDSVGYDEWKEKFRYEYKNNTAHLPCVYDYGRKGEVFCAYQILGINPFDLVVCLHQYKKNDRERKKIREENIKIIIDTLKELNASCDFVSAKLMEKYSLTPEQAEEKSSKYW